MSFCDRLGERIVRIFKRGVIRAVPAVLVGNILSVGYGAQFRKPYQIIYRAERFAVRPFVIFFGNREKPFSRVEFGKRNAFVGGESVENTARDEEHISRFRNGQNSETVVYHSVV